MAHPSLLHTLVAHADQDPLLEMFLLTAIDHYAESLAGLDEEALRQRVLENSPRVSLSGIDAEGWKHRAQLVRQILKADFQEGNSK